MARARNIKPGFFTNENLAECSPYARLVFIGLWSLADREGRLEDRPKRIKMALLPADNVDCDELLNDLERAGFLCRYSANTVKYIQILNFTKHQNPHCKEAPSTIPAPDLHSINPADSLIPDSLIQKTNTQTPEYQEATAEAVDNSAAPCVSQVEVQKPKPETPKPETTPAGLACRAMRQAGIADTNPSHPALLALLEAGATAQEFADTAAEFRAKGKPLFAYVLGAMRRRREEAAAAGAVPRAQMPEQKPAHASHKIEVEPVRVLTPEEIEANRKRSSELLSNVKKRA